MNSCTEYIMEMFSTTRCVVLVPWVPISKVGVKVPGDAWIFSVLSDRKKNLESRDPGSMTVCSQHPSFSHEGEVFFTLRHSKHALHVSAGSHCLYIARMFTVQMSWKLSVGWSVVRVSTYRVHRNVRNCRVIAQGELSHSSQLHTSDFIHGLYPPLDYQLTSFKNFISYFHYLWIKVSGHIKYFR